MKLTLIKKIEKAHMFINVFILAIIYTFFIAHLSMVF
jgi:hypothetical protein